MEIKIVTPKIKKYLDKHKLNKKCDKMVSLFETNPRHPSLHTEILEPTEEMICSFRLDKKYRALFVIKNDTAFVFRITNHYR